MAIQVAAVTLTDNRHSYQGSRLYYKYVSFIIMQDSKSAPINHHVNNLRKVLNAMFPQAYIQQYHTPPNSVCSLFSLKCSLWSSSSSAAAANNGQDDCNQDVLIRDGILTGQQQQQLKRPNVKLEASSEPSSRTEVVSLREQLNSSLVEHQAKAIGLCPIRRAIYDQCFDELIRQVTVGCIEQGLLFFRIRNELRMTIDIYRRAYESGLRFGLNKAIGAELQLEQERSKIDQLELLAKKRDTDLYMIDNIIDVERTNKLEDFEKVRAYYESELAKKERIITEQRNIIKALTQKYTNDITSPTVEG